MIWQFANGMDTSAVAKYEYKDVVAPIKSIGNSWTTPRDLMTDEDVWIVLYLLSESVGGTAPGKSFPVPGRGGDASGFEPLCVRTADKTRTTHDAGAGDSASRLSII